MGLEELARLLCFFRVRHHTLARSDDKHREVVAMSIHGIENVITEAETIRFCLTPEVECLDRRFAFRPEQVDRVSVALGFEELPNGANFHPRGHLMLHFLHVVKQFESLRIARCQKLFKIALEAEMPPVEHERVDIAPDLGQMRYRAHAPIEIRRGRNGKGRANPRTAMFAARSRHHLNSRTFSRNVTEDMLR